MPRPTMGVNGPEYQAILRGRELYRRYGMNYKDVMWMEDTLDRLERKWAYGDYTDKDRADFLKAKAIHVRFVIKAWKAAEETTAHHTTPLYTWRTQEDDKVRPDHAANDGKVFAWDDPPPTGNPGEGYGCRCWAEPYAAESELEEGKSQYVTSVVDDASVAWTRDEFIAHYLVGEGEGVTLFGIGHLQNVINYASDYDQPSGGSIFERVENQIFAKARQVGEGDFTCPFENSYDFTGVAWEIGGATVRGSAEVHVVEKGDFLVISSDVDYHFYDRFTDPLDVGNRIPGNFDIVGTPYDITGEWSTYIEAIIKK